MGCANLNFQNSCVSYAGLSNRLTQVGRGKTSHWLTSVCNMLQDCLICEVLQAKTFRMISYLRIINKLDVKQGADRRVYTFYICWLHFDADFTRTQSSITPEIATCTHQDELRRWAASLVLWRTFPGPLLTLNALLCRSSMP